MGDHGGASLAINMTDPRIEVQLRLALLEDGDDAGDEKLIGLEVAGRSLGLTGAELDAARSGRCFDVQAAAAVDYAIALTRADGAQIKATRRLAVRAGLDAADLRAIEHVTCEQGSIQGDRSTRHA